MRLGVHAHRAPGILISCLRYPDKNRAEPGYREFEQPLNPVILVGRAERICRTKVPAVIDRHSGNFTRTVNVCFVIIFPNLQQPIKVNSAPMTSTPFPRRFGCNNPQPETFSFRRSSKHLCRSGREGRTKSEELPEYTCPPGTNSDSHNAVIGLICAPGLLGGVVGIPTAGARHNVSESGAFRTGLRRV
eukprot:1121400-Rhodomonas_salina.1